MLMKSENSKNQFNFVVRWDESYQSKRKRLIWYNSTHKIKGFLQVILFTIHKKFITPVVWRAMRYHRNYILSCVDLVYIRLYLTKNENEKFTIIITTYDLQCLHSSSIVTFQESEKSPSLEPRDNCGKHWHGR